MRWPIALRRPPASHALAFFMACALAGVTSLVGGCVAAPVAGEPEPSRAATAGPQAPANAPGGAAAGGSRSAAVAVAHAEPGIGQGGAAADRAGAPFAVRTLPGAAGSGVSLQALVRPERFSPARYRVIVVPGSGCAGLGPWAERYFAGLLHAQVLVLHKPGVDTWARTAPADCGSGFVQRDRHSSWVAHALAALAADEAEQARERERTGASALPQLLVGVSEGAELLPALAPQVPRLAGLVLVGASGLDPQHAGALQAKRRHALRDWQALGQAVQGPLPDGTVLQGRSLGYWRDLWRWPVAEPLLHGPWPLLQAWGSADALVPPAAYAQFARRAAGRRAPYCAWVAEGAGHGLQGGAGPTGPRDGLQRLWAIAERWARAPAQGLCGPLDSTRE